MSLKVTWKIKNESDRQYEAEAKYNETLYDILVRNGAKLQASCGGSGHCGKCGVTVVKGTKTVSKQDQAFFSKEELAAGKRLSCCLKLQQDTEVLLESFLNASILTEYTGTDISPISETGHTQKNSPSSETGLTSEKSEVADNKTAVGAAIDIGTTTIVWQAVNLESGGVMATYAELNRNISYGSDVLSRIQASVQGKGKAIQQQLKMQLEEGIRHLADMTGSMPEKIIIAANTTMIHLLMGYDCSRLGTYPFQPVTVERIDMSLMPGTEKIPCIILPGISAFVGADILAGLTRIHFYEKKEPCFFLDIGTNGEMALFDGKARCLVTSASAGPAFEGGNISCGTGCIDGAVEKAVIRDGHCVVKTIRNQQANGICGSATIELLYELKKNKLIDEAGLLVESYREKGYLVTMDAAGKEIRLTQDDIRALQMAKGAIAAGVDILLKRMKMTPDMIKEVYLSGGFAAHLDLHKALGIGLLPKVWENRICVVGNTSLQGAAGGFFEKNDDIYRWERSMTQEIYLSGEDEFEPLYLKNMYL